MVQCIMLSGAARRPQHCYLLQLIAIACACVCVCVFMLYALNFDSICVCKERVSTQGLCGLGTVSIHYYYYLYVQVFGKLETSDKYERLEFQHANSKVHPPRQNYSPSGVFMSFEFYHVEERDRVKCISAMEGKLCHPVLHVSCHVIFRHSRGTNASVTSCSEVQMHVPSHVMFRHSRGTNVCVWLHHVQTLQRYKCICPVTPQSLSHNGFQHKAACGKVGDQTNGSCGHQKPVESHVPFASSSLLGLTLTHAASFNMEATSFQTVTSHWPLVIWKSVQLSKGCVTKQLYSSCDSGLIETFSPGIKK